MDAVNTYKVFDFLWSSGQLSEADIHRLPGLGINLVINLALPTSANALENESSLVTSLGIAYVHIPVVWEQPELEQFTQFSGVLEAFRGKKMWIHCAMNMRASAFIYLFRKLVLGESDDDASFPMRAIWQPDETWQKFIDNVSHTYTVGTP